MNPRIRDLLQESDGSALAARMRAAIQDDPLSILQVAAVVGTEEGAWPTAAVSRACREELDLLEEAKPVDISTELEQSLLGSHADQALFWLQEIGLFRKLLPELEATVDLTQEPGRHHKDVWQHTVLVVKQSVKRPAVRWAALFHDIGKVPTRTFTPSGVHFHGHAEVGARMFDKICKRLVFERQLRSKVRFLIKHHLRAAQYGEDWTDSAVRRFYRDMGEHLTDALDLSRADITSKCPGRRRALLFQISSLDDRIDKLRAEDEVVPPLPSGLGNEIMERFDLRPSRFIGTLRQRLEAAVEAGELEAHRESGYYLEYLARTVPELGDQPAPTDGDPAHAE